LFTALYAANGQEPRHPERQVNLECETLYLFRIGVTEDPAHASGHHAELQIGLSS
jgi:hypothetical protein